MAALATRSTSGINKRGAWLLRKDARTHSQPVKHHTPTPGHPARRATSPRLARTADPATRAPVPSANPTACAPPTPSHHHPRPGHNTQTGPAAPTRQTATHHDPPPQPHPPQRTPPPAPPNPARPPATRASQPTSHEHAPRPGALPRTTTGAFTGMAARALQDRWLQRAKRPPRKD